MHAAVAMPTAAPSHTAHRLGRRTNSAKTKSANIGVVSSCELLFTVAAREGGTGESKGGDGGGKGGEGVTCDVALDVLDARACQQDDDVNQHRQQPREAQL